MKSFCNGDYTVFRNLWDPLRVLIVINKDRQDIYLYDFFSLFLDVQSAPEVGPTSYTLHIH